MIEINLQDWLLSEATTGTEGGNQIGIPGNVPLSQSTDNPPPSASPQGDPNIANMPTQNNMRTDDQQGNEEIPDYSDDPQNPEMPDDMEGDEDLDFQKFKKAYLVESVKGDISKLKDLLLKVRDYKLSSYERKFIEDNLQIIYLRENSNIDEATKKIRKGIKDDLDHNNPSVSLVDHITSTLESIPLLNPIFIKLSGLRSMKAELHREFIASILGAVQVGSGGINEDLILNEKEFRVNISTRFNARFGEIVIGPWELKEDDIGKFLEAPEIKRLEDGSPEEKTALRARIIMESIAETYEKRAFIINVVDESGTIYSLGWDLGVSLRTAYTEGNLIVKTELSDSEISINEDGETIKFPEIKILYVKESGELNKEGKPAKEESEFIVKKNGQLFLVASLQTIKEASTSFSGINLKEVPWQGSPTDIQVLRRCVPSSSECLLRNC